MQIVSIYMNLTVLEFIDTSTLVGSFCVNSLHKMPNSVFWEKQEKSTVYIKCQILFSGKNKKSMSKCCLLKILPRVLSLKYVYPMTIQKIINVPSNLQRAQKVTIYQDYC